MFEEQIGRIHPDFFRYNVYLSQLEVTQEKKGWFVIESPFFSLTYDFMAGVLFGMDQDVLLDVVDLIRNEYGTSLTRDEFKKQLDWESFQDVDYNVLNAGVCWLEDGSGWDGSINSVWFDEKKPGQVIDIYFQYWNRRLLRDAWKLDLKDVNNLGGTQVVLPSLYESLLFVDAKKVDTVNSLIVSLV